MAQGEGRMGMVKGAGREEEKEWFPLPVPLWEGEKGGIWEGENLGKSPCGSEGMCSRT